MASKTLSETDILQTLYREHSSLTSGGGGGGDGVNEIALYKYSMSPAASASTPENSWVDGNIFPYLEDTKDWSIESVKVKFYIMGEEYSSESKRKEVYMIVEEMMKLPGCSSVITPLFATYNSHVQRVVVCYPYFDQHLKDWLPVNQVPVGEHTLPPIWNNLIRALLPCVSTYEKLLIRNPEDKSSYVWLMEPNEIRIVLFPECEESGGRYFKSLAAFLRECLYSQWKNRDLLSFIQMLERAENNTSDANLQFFTAHPLLQDLDSLSVMIRTTWRPSSALSRSQKTELDSTIIPTNWGNHVSWKQLPVQDAILHLMLLNRTDDASGLFAYVKEICAHYTEKRRSVLGNSGEHPVLRIKRCFPGLVTDIYSLSLNPKWLTRH